MPSFFLRIRPPPRSPLFPYTPLFRSAASNARSSGRRVTVNTVGAKNLRWRSVVDRKSTRLNSSHSQISYAVFFFKDTPTPEISPLSLHAALPICRQQRPLLRAASHSEHGGREKLAMAQRGRSEEHTSELQSQSNLVCRLFF